MTRAWPLKPVHRWDGVRLGRWRRQRTFSAPIDKRLEGLRVLRVNHVNECRIDPPASFNGVQPANDEIKLHVVVLIFVLNLAKVSERAQSFGWWLAPKNSGGRCCLRSHSDARNALHNELCSDCRLRLSNVLLPDGRRWILIANVRGLPPTWTGTVGSGCWCR